jgi:hypothetical protein
LPDDVALGQDALYGFARADDDHGADIVGVEHGNRIGQRVAVAQGIDGRALGLQDGVDNQSQVLLARTNRDSAVAGRLLENRHTRLGLSGMSIGKRSVHPKPVAYKAEKGLALGPAQRLWRKVNDTEGSCRTLVSVLPKPTNWWDADGAASKLECDCARRNGRLRTAWS